MSEIHHFIFFILFYFIFLYNKAKQIFLCIPDLLIGYLLSSIAELINNVPHQNIKRLSSNWNRLRREREIWKSGNIKHAYHFWSRKSTAKYRPRSLVEIKLPEGGVSSPVVDCSGWCTIRYELHLICRRIPSFYEINCAKLSTTPLNVTRISPVCQPDVTFNYYYMSLQLHYVWLGSRINVEFSFLSVIHLI